MKGLLSVIIPVYNTEKYLNRCLSSVVGQAYKNLEIIIVDDGSTDSSFSICKKFEHEDSRVVVFTNEGKGVSSARNYGMRKAKGEYLTFVDSDDYLEPDAYKKAMSNIDDCDAIFYGYYEEYEKPKGKIPISPTYIGVTSSFNAIYSCMLPSRDCYFTSVWNKIFKKEKVSDLLFNELYNMGEDEVWLVESIFRLSKIKLYNEPLYNYFQRPNSALHNSDKINHNWISFVLAKEDVIKQVSNDKKHFNQIVAKEYNDLFYTVIHSYVVDGYSKSIEVFKRIRKYEKHFLFSNCFGIKRKFKIYFVFLLIKLRFPRKLIYNLWYFSTLELKLKILNGER